MNKLELIQALKDSTDLSKSEAARVVDVFFNEMSAAPWQKGNGLKFGVSVPFSSRNTGPILDAIRKLVSG